MSNMKNKHENYSYCRGVFYSCSFVISTTWNTLVPQWRSNPSDEKCLLHFSSGCKILPGSACLCVFHCSSCNFAHRKWKSSKIKSTAITTSSNLECNYTVTLSGQWLRSKSIRLCSKWNGTDWLIYVCQMKGKETDKKETTECESGSGDGGGGGVCVGGRGVADTWMEHGPLMGEGEYWIRQRQMECERQRERNSDGCLLTSTLFSN